MHRPELTLPLDPATRQALDDLADAQGRTPEDVVLDAVRRHLHDEENAVRAVAERLAGAHAELLRRLGE
jgi:predicted transcriptional regulator